MKRFILGVGWFSIINFLLSGISSFIVGAIAGFGTANTAEGAQAGAVAAAVFQQQYGGILLLVAVIVAIAGTMTGILPYTKKEIHVSDN